MEVDTASFLIPSDLVRSKEKASVTNLLEEPSQIQLGLIENILSQLKPSQVPLHEAHYEPVRFLSILFKNTIFDHYLV